MSKASRISDKRKLRIDTCVVYNDFSWKTRYISISIGFLPGLIKEKKRQYQTYKWTEEKYYAAGVVWKVSTNLLGL